MSEGFGYPVAVALAYLFFAAYLANRMLVACRLPGAVGVILVGFAFSFFIQDEILVARDTLQQLAFFLVLLTAGLEITPSDLNKNVFVMSFFPVLLEMIGITLCSVFTLGYNWVQSTALAIALCCIGDGLVIPKMKEFFTEFPGHPMPRLIFTWAPLEASLTLTLFGVLEPLACPEGVEPSPLEYTIIGNILILVATFLGGLFLGNLCARIVMHRSAFKLIGRQLFTGSNVEAFLMILAFALFAFGCGHSGHHGPWVPIPLTSSSMFQPELLVIITGSAFGALVSEKVLHGVEATMGGVWVFGQLVLFSMIGSKTDISIFCCISAVIPIIFCGLVCRFLGVVLAMAWVRKELKRPPSAFFPDVIFCFTSTLPRATLQGALSDVPLTKRYFYGMQFANEAQVFIAVAGKIYIVLFSVLGSVLVDTVGVAMLRATAGSEDVAQVSPVTAASEIVPFPVKKKNDSEACGHGAGGVDSFAAGA